MFASCYHGLNIYVDTFHIAEPGYYSDSDIIQITVMNKK